MSKAQDLINATKEGNIDKIKQLIGECQPEDHTEVTDLINENILFFACRKSSAAIIKLIVKNVGKDIINAHNQRYETALNVLINNSILVDNEKKKIFSLLIDKMSIDAINFQDTRGYTFLHKLVLKCMTSGNPNLYLEITKILLNKVQAIVNIKAAHQMTALDWIANSKNPSEEFAKLLIEKGGTFGEISSECRYQPKDWFKPFAHAVRIIDHIIGKEEFCLGNRIEEKFDEMLINRMFFTLKEKYGIYIDKKDYEDYELFFTKITRSVPKNLYEKIISNFNNNFIMRDEIKETILTKLEATLISLFEGKGLCDVPLEHLLKAAIYNFNNFAMEQKTLDFHRDNPKYTKPGAYLYELLRNQKMLIEKLKDKPQGLEILRKINEEISLPKFLKIKLDNLLDKVIYEDEVINEQELFTAKIHDLLKEMFTKENLLKASSKYEIYLHPETQQITVLEVIGQDSDLNELASVE